MECYLHNLLKGRFYCYVFLNPTLLYFLSFVVINTAHPLLCVYSRVILVLFWRGRPALDLFYSALRSGSSEFSTLSSSQKMMI